MNEWRKRGKERKIKKKNKEGKKKGRKEKRKERSISPDIKKRKINNWDKLNLKIKMWLSNETDDRIALFLIRN